MCADIRDGREQLLPSKGRIQMSKTNYLQAVISDLQRTAGPYRSARSYQNEPTFLDRGLACVAFAKSIPGVGVVVGTHTKIAVAVLQVYANDRAWKIVRA